MYTFARNHNENGRPQEPYAMDKDVLVSAKVNLRLRYSLLKYIYNFLIEKRGKGTIWKALFFSFPKD